MMPNSPPPPSPKPGKRPWERGCTHNIFIIIVFRKFRFYASTRKQRFHTWNHRFRKVSFRYNTQIFWWNLSFTRNNFTALLHRWKLFRGFACYGITKSLHTFRSSSYNILMPSSLGSVSKLCEITLFTCTTCYGKLRYWRGRQWENS